ncbi:cadherin domain-containing protein, partial [Pseudomonadota bacterium]|nr:cadherin domain-containing protein [Pseudomonadota bacterium]
MTNNAFAQEQIGVASAVNKNTTDLTLEQERKLIDAGYEIIQNHTIETDGIGRAQMLLLDGTAFSVGPNSSVVLDKFIYNPETAEGSLEVTARGLLRIVGGKVTKKQPALIRTNSATVGIRGGIGIVQTNGSQTNATFLYGTEMTVTPNCVDLDTFGDQCSSDFVTTVTEPGFSVSVEDEDSEPSEPVEVTEESLDAIQEELEAPEEAPEEEAAAEETATEEETSEGESAAEETPGEETQEEETTTEETSSNESAVEETNIEEIVTDTESEAPADIETETEVASDDAGDSTDIEVDEGLLDSSGVSDVSSDVAPEELGTAEEFEVAIELETVEADDANEDTTGDVTEEVAETTQETTVEVAPIFQVNAGESIESISENVASETLTPLVFINPGDLNYSITISGDDAELVEFDMETQSINLISALDYETQTKLSFTVTIESENADISEIEVLLDVTNIDEPIELTSTLLADSFAENIDLQSAILESTAIDPEGGDISFTLSGEGSENFSVDANGNISLQTELDYETTTSYDLVLTASDGANDTVFEISFSVIDIDEPAILTANTSATSFAEDSLTGINIGTASATDPEGQTVTFSLSGTGSENFSVDSSGNISLVNSLDYETATSHTLTLNASDGVNTTSSKLIITVDDVNEAPSLTNALAASSFAENASTGTTIATASASDPESQAITYSLSGTGSGNFAVDSSGNITLAAGLDYETANSYSLTLSASDGVNTTTNTLAISISDVNEAPSLTNSLAASSFAENVSTGTTIATASASDPEAQTITYSLSGTGSDKFAVDSAGNITLSSALDYETTTSYSLTLTASDGANSTSNTINISVDDVVELSIALASSSISLNETATSGTSVTTTSTTTDGSATVSYSLSGTGSDNFAVSSNGTITTAASLDYETTTSYSLTLTASDGTNTVTENFTVSITDINLSLSASLASAAQSEGISTGTSIATSSSSNADGTVTYSLTDADNKFKINSSTGAVTLANALDYETKTSHEFTITATDGVTTTSETFTLSVSDLKINTLAVTLANSGAALAESSSSGTTVGSSSITNPESETVSYALSGTGSSNFAVDSSGNVTTNATLDFETAKSYSLTLTATAGGNTTTDAFTVNVGNVEELESAVLRYSADYNSASRSGFSATATRGPSGSSLAAYTLEQVGTTNSTAITSVDDTSNNYVPVEINSGTALNWRYYFPIDTFGHGEFGFAPNSASVDGKYYSPLGTAVTTTIANADFLTAGRLEGAEYWFMTTDKAGASISYDSQTGISGTNAYFYFGGSVATTSLNVVEPIIDDDFTTYSNLGGNTLGYTSTCAWANLGCNSLLFSEDFSLLWFHYSGNVFAPADSDRLQSITTALTDGATVVVLLGEHSGGCCGGSTGWLNAINIFAALGWSGYSSSHISGATSYSDNRHPITNPSTSYPNSWVPYSTMPTHISWAAAGYLDIPSVCTGLTANNSLFICDPSATGLAGTFIGYADLNVINYWNNSDGTAKSVGASICPSQVNSEPCDNTPMWDWFAEVAKAGGGNATTSTYNLYEDQVTLAGEVYKDANFVSFTDSNKRVIAMAVIPLENFTASGTTNDYFYPNFIPTNVWSYGDVGLNYCAATGNSSSACAASYSLNYNFATNALEGEILSNRMTTSTSYLPEGTSLWWQVLNPSGVGAGLWAQISLKDSYDGASGSTTRDDQQSLLNVVISNIDYRKNDTTRYSAGDTGLGMDGYHYWSYQGATNADNDGLGINYGTSPIECATSNDSGCFWGDVDGSGAFNNQPGGAMITSSDPYKSGSMTLGVNYNSNNDTFSTGSFNVSAVVQNVKKSIVNSAYHSLSDFRSSDFYSSSATGYSGFFSGILEFDVSGTGNSQLSSIRSSSTLATFTFDTTNDDVQVVAPMTISAAPSNNYTSNWSTVDTGSMTLKFGDATNDEAKSAYISSEVFAAEIQDDGAQIDGTSGGSNNLAGVMVSYNTIDKEDTELFHTGGNDSMPDTAYSTWGFWA